MATTSKRSTLRLRPQSIGHAAEAGQPIARLDPSDLQLAAESAKTQIVQLEAERRFAEGDLRRYRELREKNFISQAELDRRASTFESTDARLDSASPPAPNAQLLSASPPYRAGFAIWVFSGGMLRPQRDLKRY